MWSKTINVVVVKQRYDRVWVCHLQPTHVNEPLRHGVYCIFEQIPLSCIYRHFSLVTNSVLNENYYKSDNPEQPRRSSKDGILGLCPAWFLLVTRLQLIFLGHTYTHHTDDAAGENPWFTPGGSHQYSEQPMGVGWGGVGVGGGGRGGWGSHPTWSFVK